MEDTDLLAVLASLNLEWHELTDAENRTLILVCPEGKEPQLAKETIDVFRLANVGTTNLLVTDNQLVAAYFYARRCQEMNTSMRNQIISTCADKINKR